MKPFSSLVILFICFYKVKPQAYYDDDFNETIFFNDFAADMPNNCPEGKFIILNNPVEDQCFERLNQYMEVHILVTQKVQ